MEDNTQRLDKYLANLGVCSRRNVEELLKNQILTVNGRKALEPGTRINPKKDQIQLNGKNIVAPALVYYLLNKPKGIISTASDEQGRQDVTSLVPTTKRLYPVGRLDKDTTGLIILTNDGELTNMLTHPRYEVHKVYRLTIRGRIHERQLESLQEGIELEDGVTAPAGVRVLKQEGAATILELAIHEGKNRQVRRMCEAIRIPLISLERIKFGPLHLGSLKEGRYRVLTDKEVNELRKAAVPHKTTA